MPNPSRVTVPLMAQISKACHKVVISCFPRSSFDDAQTHHAVGIFTRKKSAGQSIRYTVLEFLLQLKKCLL